MGAEVGEVKGAGDGALGEPFFPLPSTTGVGPQVQLVDQVQAQEPRCAPMQARWIRRYALGTGCAMEQKERNNVETSTAANFAEVGVLEHRWVGKLVRSGVEEAFEVVGDLFVVEGDGVRVVAESGGRVAVAKPGLSLEELALVDEVGGDAVAEAVEGGGPRWPALNQPGCPLASR